jgi:hypothetical protein
MSLSRSSNSLNSIIDKNTDLQPYSSAVHKPNKARGLSGRAKPAKKAAATTKDWLNMHTPLKVIMRAANLIHILTKFVLQLCAVQSQLNEHEQALENSKLTGSYAKDLSYLTKLVIQIQLNKISDRYDLLKKSSIKSKGTVSNPF